MNRRELLHNLLWTGIAAGLNNPEVAPAAGVATASKRGAKLFPTDLPSQKWVEFPAAGFSGPAAGVIYRRDQPPRQGMALGAIDTGYMSLETDGTLGFCTIFNS